MIAPCTELRQMSPGASAACSCRKASVRFSNSRWPTAAGLMSQHSPPSDLRRCLHLPTIRAPSRSWKNERYPCAVEIDRAVLSGRARKVVLRQAVLLHLEEILHAPALGGRFDRADRGFDRRARHAAA